MLSFFICLNFIDEMKNCLFLKKKKPFKSASYTVVSFSNHTYYIKNKLVTKKIKQHLMQLKENYAYLFFTFTKNVATKGGNRKPYNYRVGIIFKHYSHEN